MKWSLAQLKKLDKPIMLDTTLDFSNDLVNMEDVRSISPVVVKGTCYEMSEDEFVFSLDVECELILRCAITTDDVPYRLAFHTDEVFALSNDDDEDINIIEGETIDLVPVILSDIVIRIPMRIVKEGAIYESDEPEEKINPAFADLKDFLK